MLELFRRRLMTALFAAVAAVGAVTAAAAPASAAATPPRADDFTLDVAVDTARTAGLDDHVDLAGATLAGFTVDTSTLTGIAVQWAPDGTITVNPHEARDFSISWTVTTEAGSSLPALMTVHATGTSSFVSPTASSFAINAQVGVPVTVDLLDHAVLGSGSFVWADVAGGAATDDGYGDLTGDDSVLATLGATRDGSHVTLTPSVAGDFTLTFNLIASTAGHSGADGDPSNDATLTVHVNDGAPSEPTTDPTEPTDPPTTTPGSDPSDGVAVRPAGSDGIASSADRQVTTVDTPVRITGVRVGLEIAQLVEAFGASAVVADPARAGSAAVVEGTGAVLYTPAPGFVGTDTVTVYANRNRVGTFMVFVNQPTPAANAISSTVTAQAKQNAAFANTVFVDVPLASLPLCDLSAGVSVVSWSGMPAGSSGYASSACGTSDVVELTFDEPAAGFTGATPTITYWSTSGDPVSLTVNVTPPASMWEAREGRLGDVRAGGDGGWNLVAGRLPDGASVELAGSPMETDGTTGDSTTAENLTLSPSGAVAYRPSIPSGTLTLTWHVIGAGQDDATFTSTVGVSPVETKPCVNQVNPWYFTWAGQPVSVSPAYGSDAITGAADLAWTYQPTEPQIPGTVTGSGKSFTFTPAPGFTGTTAFSFLSDQPLDGYGYGERVPVTVYVTVFGPVVTDHSVTVQAGNWATTDDLLDPVLWGTVGDLRAASDEYIAHSSLASGVGGAWWISQRPQLLGPDSPPQYVPVPVADDAAMPTSSADMVRLDDPLGASTFSGAAALAGPRSVRLKSSIVQQTALAFVAVTSDGIVGAPARINVTVTPSVSSTDPAPSPTPGASTPAVAPPVDPHPTSGATVRAADPPVPPVTSVDCSGRPGTACTGASGVEPLAVLAGLLLAAGVGVGAVRRRLAPR